MLVCAIGFVIIERFRVGAENFKATNLGLR